MLSSQEESVRLAAKSKEAAAKRYFFIVNMMSDGLYMGAKELSIKIETNETCI
jgi:hypothetical protein